MKKRLTRPARVPVRLVPGGPVRQMAKAIGLNERTIRRYVTPGATIPRVVELAARWAAQEALRKLSEM